MSNLVYPASSSIKIINPIDITLQYQTLTSERFDTIAPEQRKVKREFPARLLNLNYKGLTPTEIRTLFQFYQDMQGRYEDFAFFTPSVWDKQLYEDEYVGIGDGSTTTFNMPCKSATDDSTRIIYVDDEEMASGAEYDYYETSAVQGGDLLTFASAPADGEVVTADFTGHLRVRCIFANDSMSFSQYSDLVGESGSGIKLQGLLNE